MAKNYDNYGYDDDYNNGRTSLIRKILIVLMIVIAIILIVVLIKGCSSSGKTKPADKIIPKFNYEEALLKAGKDYYSSNTDKQPGAAGECTIVELKKLMENNLVDKDKFGNCNQSTTFVKLCILEDGTKHYTPWLTCVDKNSENEYGALGEGSAKDVIANSTYVDFKFLPQEMKKGGDILGDVEEKWKDEITYSSYKTLATTNYYRYRDKAYIWDLVKRTYYTSTGNKSSASAVNEYYASSPKSGFNLKSNRVTAYKWYTSSGTKEYYTKNGVKAYSASAVGEYTIRDPQGVTIVRYRTRTITGNYSPKKFYVCTTSASGVEEVIKAEPCNKDTSSQYRYQKEIIYSCARDGELIKANQVSGPNATCHTYSAWSDPTPTACDTTKTDVCQKATAYLYYWYKIVNEVRTYYPSGAKSAGGENVYYTSSPKSGAIKDTKTAATAYKWYKETKTQSDDFSVLPPSGYTATKTDEYKWTDWSSWSTKNPKISDGRDRYIEKRVKIKLQEIKGKDNEGWQDMNSGYLTEQELITLYQNKGYKVNTLEDIVNNGEIRYQIKLFVRNKKESI